MRDILLFVYQNVVILQSKDVNKKVLGIKTNKKGKYEKD